MPGGGVVGGIPSRSYYVTRYDPILPGLGRTHCIDLAIIENELPQFGHLEVKWTVFADNAATREGRILVGEIPVDIPEEDDL